MVLVWVKSIGLFQQGMTLEGKALKEFSIESAAMGFLGGAEEEVFRSELKEIEG